MKTKTIKSVHLLDISNLMVSLGIKDSFEKGILSCGICGEPIIDLKKIFCFYPLENEVKVCCRKKSCIYHISAEGSVNNG